VRARIRLAHLIVLSFGVDVRLLTACLIVASSAYQLSAQSLISRDSITPSWARRQLIGGIDSGPRIGSAWACIKSWPEVTNALIVVYKQSDSPSLVGDDAILMLGGTGQDSAFRFLVATLDGTAPNDPIRQDLLLALGNSAEPPDFVYERLEVILTSGSRADFGMALRALSDIRSPAAYALLRKTRAATTDAARKSMIDGTLARMEKGHPRIVSTCDSTRIAPDRE
jgi:hypothetical protein